MKKTMGVGAICVIVSLILFAFSASDLYDMAFNRIRIEDTGYGAYEEDQIAEGELSFVLAKLGETEDTKKVFVIPAGSVKTSLYLIYDNGGYVVVGARESAEKFDRLAEQTTAYLDKGSGVTPDKIEFVGKTEEIDDEELSILNEYFTAKNIEKEYWQSSISLYVLKEFDSTSSIVEVCISGALLLIGIVLLIISRRYRYGEEVYVGEKIPEELLKAAEEDQAGPAGEDAGSR